MGTAVTARARLNTRNFRMGMRGPHFDARHRRRVRRSRARLRYFEGSRVCRHVISSKVLRGASLVKSTLRSRFHPLQLLRCGAERRLPVLRGSICKPCIKARMRRFCPRKWSRQNAGVYTVLLPDFCLPTTQLRMLQFGPTPHVTKAESGKQRAAPPPQNVPAPV